MGVWKLTFEGLGYFGTAVFVYFDLVYRSYGMDKNKTIIHVNQILKKN